MVTNSLFKLAKIILKLQKSWCSNINLVSPTHFIPQILNSIHIAMKKGLILPLVYNTGGYETKKTIELLDGIVDIYLPDAKYGTDRSGEKYSKASEYWSNLQIVLPAMHNQVGNLKINEKGEAKKGLLVRHFVLPNGVASSKKIIEFIEKEISKGTYVNIMDQYRPCYKADSYPEINRGITNQEYNELSKMAEESGIISSFNH